VLTISTRPFSRYKLSSRANMSSPKPSYENRMAADGDLMARKRLFKRLYQMKTAVHLRKTLIISGQLGPWPFISLTALFKNMLSTPVLWTTIDKFLHKLYSN
jgi:hypothetical protein